MRKFKFIPFCLFLGLSIVLVSCGGDATDEANGGQEGEDVAVMTTEEFIAEANKLGKEEFEKKYPRDSEIELQGEVRVPATWDDKVAAKFGTGMNDLPLTADFMFEANGGKDATKKKVEIGKNLVFTGKVGFFFYKDDKLSRCSFSDCIAK